jgi:2'-hydroxyisoflavone reductase
MRPGLIVGPNDPTDRFTYWPVRVARDGDVLAPEKPEAPAQIIDARDLSDFIITLIETTHRASITQRIDYALTLGRMLESCKQVSGSDANFRWAPVDFLKRHNVAEWSDMPAWDPRYRGKPGLSRIKCINDQRWAEIRPLEETIRYPCVGENASSRSRVESGADRRKGSRSARRFERRVRCISTSPAHNSIIYFGRRV